MKMFLTLTLTSVLSISAYAKPQKSTHVSNEAAEALFLDFGGEDASASTDANTGVVTKTVRVTDVSCSIQTETQKGDPNSKEEILSFVICGFTDKNGETGDVLGENAGKLLLDLKKAGVARRGTALNSTRKATSISCTQAVEKQQGDADSIPESLTTYSCDIQN